MQTGGPLIIPGNGPAQDLQVGIVSWGYGCASANFPGIYARLDVQRDYVLNTLCTGKDDYAPLCSQQSTAAAIAPPPTRRPTVAPTPFDACAPKNPCQNGGKCTDEVGGFTCACPSGWGGNTCKVDIDNACAPTNPCKNGGECIDKIGGYTCTCKNGFSGTNCNIAPPTPVPPPLPLFSGELGGDIDWHRGTVEGGKKFDILQCQNVVVDWSAGTNRDDLPHSIYEFNGPEAYKNCDKSQATRLVPPMTTATHVIGQEETFDVKRRYFGSLEGDDCTTGRMRFSIKVRPRLQHKFPGYECDGSNAVKVKTTETLIDCRRMCKKLQGCNAIQYNNKKRCRIYNIRPKLLVESNAGTTCEIAAQDCDASSELSLLAINKNTPETGDNYIIG